MQIQILLDHCERPRHRGALEDADVAMPGGNPGCGDVVTVYLKGAGDNEHIEDVSYEGEGCTISMAASSMLLEHVHDGDLTMEQVLEMDYNEMIEQLGRQIVASRPKCATLGLGTLKAAIRKYQKDRRLAEAGVAPRTMGVRLRRGRSRSREEELARCLSGSTPPYGRLVSTLG